SPSGGCSNGALDEGTQAQAKIREHRGTSTRGLACPSGKGGCVSRERAPGACTVSLCCESPGSDRRETQSRFCYREDRWLGQGVLPGQEQQPPKTERPLTGPLRARPARAIHLQKTGLFTVYHRIADHPT